MKKLLLLLFLLPVLSIAQPTSSSTQDFGNSQNNILGNQSRSFGGGSIIKPNPILTSADFALIGSNTYEKDQPAFRPGTGLGYGRFNMGKGWGVNAVLTFDLSQQTYSVYYRTNKWYYHVNLGKMAVSRNTGASITRVFSTGNFGSGIQVGAAVVANGKKDYKDAYFVLVPYAVLFFNEQVDLNNTFQWGPEAFFTFCAPYYDIGLNSVGVSNTFNAVVGNNISAKISKKFKLNINWRMNMNTTPKWGVMHNILFGTNVKF
jgi:hypothetical protein